MGLDPNTTRFLLYAKRCGVDFSHSATIGRQFFYLDAPVLAGILKDFGYSLPEAEVGGLLSRNQGYTEGLFELLGARQIRSFDASAYEGASDLHDFNLPVPDTLCNQFTAVIDSGSLEHVFNVPVAIKNCMQMVRVGGHFLGMSPANNWFGHGFYQFSSELFFRAFSHENGFEIVRALACELGGGDWYEVVDPAVLRQRVSLVNTRETYLLILAKRVEEVPIFSALPQQSDYAEQWSGSMSRAAMMASDPVGFQCVKSQLRKAIPEPLKATARLLRLLCGRTPSPFNRRFFKKVTIP